MPTTYIVMGVSGCGKSTVGKLLAKALDQPFFDGDDYHPQANIDKMSQGIPLNDKDREPWLRRLADLYHQKGPCVIACSALKQSYREILSSNSTRFLFLKGSEALLRARLIERAGTTDHFMPTTLLASQLDTLESPETENHTITVNISHTPEEIVAIVTQQPS